MAQDERAKTPSRVHTAGTSSTAAVISDVSYGKIITVYSPKGGAGCTTVAVNLAMILHNEETPVILVDGNLQFGDVSVFLNEQGKNSQ